MNASLAKAVVVGPLPNGRFLCRSAEGRDLVCHVGGDMRMKVVRLLAGDEVTIEPSPYDPGKGRIVGRVEARRSQES